MGQMSLSVDDMGEILAAGAGVAVEVGATYTHLDHARQTAALLRDEGAGDELVVAGLLHDIGQQLPGAGDATHAEAGAAAVREALGERVAGLVGLHVAAKRYLVAGEAGYGGGLSEGSVASMYVQGGPMSSDEAAAFEANPLFNEAVILRRADDRGKVEGLVVDDLAAWMDLVRRFAAT